VRYEQDAPPQVLSANLEDLSLDREAPFKSAAYKRFRALCDRLENKFGFLTGDVNFSGILNIALDLRGQDLFLDFYDRPDALRECFSTVASVIDRFTRDMARSTGTTSISVNRTVRHLAPAVFLHSECALTMISVEHYEKFLMPFDAAFSRSHRPFGIHYCGADPERFAEAFAKLPYLDFLDVGWGGDAKKLRAHLPETFLNLRLSPVEIMDQSKEEVREAITTRVRDSGDPWLTGICCINMDDKVEDEKIFAIFETVVALREEYAAGSET
jgi:hypothetical protein